MSRAVELFKPIGRGDYWRSVLNSIKGLPSYSLDLQVELLNSHPRDGKKQYVFPYCDGRVSKPPKESKPSEMAILRQEKNIRAAQFVSDLLLAHPKEAKKAHSLALAKLKGYERAYSQLGDPNLDSVVYRCTGVRNRRIRDSRSTLERVRDFWYLSGYSYFIKDIELMFFTVFALLFDPKQIEEWIAEMELEADPFDSFVRGAVKWTYETFPDLAEGKPEDQFIYQDMAFALQQGSQMLVPIGEIEILKRLGEKVWSIDPGSQKINPVEYLILTKYIGLSALSLNHSVLDQPDVRVEFLSERRAFLTSNRRGLWSLTSRSPANDSMQLIVANAYIDFWDELNYYNQFESYKGSLQCVECGTFIARSFDAYGQKYCSDQCKKRANKKTYVKRKRLKGRLLT